MQLMVHLLFRIGYEYFANDSVLLNYNVVPVEGLLESAKFIKSCDCIPVFEVQ